jgi:GT2 family glycosyltransferase
MEVTPRPRRKLKIAVGIATIGRSEILSCTLAELRRQTRPADAIIVCAAGQTDTAGLVDLGPQVTFITGPRGSAHQRNAILDMLDEFEVVVFFDDDFVAGTRYLEAIETLFLNQPEVVVATGRVIADGACGPGLKYDEACGILEQCEHEPRAANVVVDIDSGYGCNMAIRLGPVRSQGVRFDERLPLYAWLEDVDFSRQLIMYGRVVKVTSAVGVHMGVKIGRQQGRRLGYSQIANPIYLLRKGTCSWGTALLLISRNITANLIGSVKPEPYVDRRGRIVGNVLAIIDLVSGRLDPSRVLSL